jgi:hypothetical protein
MKARKTFSFGNNAVFIFLKKKDIFHFIYLFFHFHYIYKKKKEPSVAILECPEFTTLQVRMFYNRLGR